HPDDPELRRYQPFRPVWRPQPKLFGILASLSWVEFFQRLDRCSRAADGLRAGCEKKACRRRYMCIALCIVRCIMRTNIDLDEELVKEAFKYADVKTKKELIALGLREFIENHKRRDLRDLRGKVRFREGYDHKALRSSGR